MELWGKTASIITLTLLLTGMLTLAFNIRPVKAGPKTWIVDDDGLADFHTIQEAINAANPGDTIYVRNGTYYENVVVNKTLSLLGENRERTIIDPRKTSTVILVSANNVSISNFTVRNSGSGTYDAGIFIEGDGCEINDNHIVSNYRSGVYISGLHNTLYGNNITSNFFDGVRILGSFNKLLQNDIIGNSPYQDYSGISIYGSHNIITGNNITNDRLGIWMDHAGDNRVSGNYIAYNSWGIYPFCSSDNVLSNNIITSNYWDGIEMHGPSDRNLVVDNDITSNYVGIFGGGSFNTVSSNSITNNTYGIDFFTSYNNMISGNNITTNREYGINLREGSSNNTLSGNLLATNNEGIVLEGSKENVILSNVLSDNIGYAIKLTDFSDKNRVVANNFSKNRGGIYLNNAVLNVIFHNNFLKNSPQVISANSQNIWDDGYPSGGNYWSEYSGTDLYNGNFQNVAGSDGIGDTALTIDESNEDRYPLMGPINIFDASVWDDEPKEVRVVSNSTVSSFQLDATEKTISFNVSGESVLGFCRVTVPNIILEAMWEGNYTVLVDGKRVETRNWTDVENTYIYFAYEHSEHKVTVLQTYATTLQIETTTGGTTDPPPDLYFHLVGDVVSVLTIPDLDYEFEYWIFNGVNVGPQNPIEILLDSNYTLQAVFAQITYHQLTITSTGGGTTDPAPGTHTYVNGTVVLVTALPDVGYSFDYWRLEGEVGTVNPIIILVAADGTLEAFFVDDIPPDIGSPVQDPSEDVEPYQNVTVTVSVTDLGTGVYNVTLWYSIDNGTSWTPRNMTEISTNTYQATIPGYENCTWVTYKIVAYDNAGNTAVKDNNGYHYKYHVIPEFPSTILLPLLMLTTLLATVLLKKKRKTKIQLP